MATSDLLLAAQPPVRAVLPLGDDVDECGTAQAITDLYGPSWGRLKGITRPTPGNHEYYAAYQGVPCTPPGPAGYFGYFGAAAGDPGKGYYFGLLLLTLHDDGSSWRFQATGGRVRDQGFTACH